MACKLATFARLARSKDEGGAMVHSLRSMGSAAMNLCAVAAGTIDLYWEGGCYAWDVCAGWCILKETGGIVVDSNPGGWECKLDGKRYLAVRGATGEKGVKGMTKGQESIVKEFWGCVAEGGFDYTAP
jgi:myo-inositol-1(or 4)-monophosphatase